MNKEHENSEPQVPPMEDPPLPDSYEPSPGELPEEPKEHAMHDY